ncbi:TolC family protein [Cetobacterium sp. ZWU0022]|uniref:TolC family protein n=1 Tax=Cetobacterium sp. ZWU0022 TaxID=1340502 RepID=UPI0006476E98|nr:TolC family protein [Cetobacterium sp. ZWU0022]
MKLRIFMIFTISFSLFARVITINEAIDLAIQNGEENNIANRELIISKKQLNSAFKTALPNIFYTGGYLKTDGAFLENTPIQTAKSGYINFLGISQPIFQGGSIAAKVKKAKIEEQKNTLALLKQTRDTRLEVISIYTGIILAKNTLEVYNTSKMQLNEALNFAKENERLGKITNVELLKAEYQLLDIETSILNIQNEIEIGLLTLKQKLNFSSSEEIDIENFYVYREAIDSINYNIDLDEALNNGIAANFAKLHIQEADVEKMIARAEMLPQVKGFIGKEYVTEDHRTENSWGGGVLVSWNIFQFGKDYDNYEASKLNIENSKSQEKITHNNIEINLKKAYLELIRLNKLEIAYSKAFEQANENYKKDTLKFQKGMITILDFLKSQEMLTDSKIKYENIRLIQYNALEKYRSLLI